MNNHLLLQWHFKQVLNKWLIHEFMDEFQKDISDLIKPDVCTRPLNIPAYLQRDFNWYLKTTSDWAGTK